MVLAIALNMNIALNMAMALIFACALAVPAVGQDPGEAFTLPVVERPGFLNEGAEIPLREAMESGQWIRVRELSEEILTSDPESYLGHCGLARAQRLGEGNLPVALYHAQRCRRSLEQLHGDVPAVDSPWRWHELALRELAMISGEMGRHEDKVNLLDQRAELYTPAMPAEKGWPLMRLRRYQDARQAALEGLISEDEMQVAAARTALCAIEAEMHRREESYTACLGALEHERRLGAGGTAAYTNAAEAAMGLLRSGEAERFLLEGAEQFVSGTVANPWMDLALLYVSQGRAAEGLDALREMVRWSRRQPAFLDQQNRAEREMASSVFLLAAGLPEDAARITRRALERPDRTGYTSSEAEQMAAAAALLDSAAARQTSEIKAEEAAVAAWGEGLGLRLEAYRWRLRAWRSGRQAASLLGSERMLLSTLRPYLAGSVEVPEWIEPELVAHLGPGVVAAALGRAREEETLGEAAGYLLAFQAEVAYQRGRFRQAVDLSARALERLPSSERMLQARLVACSAESSRRLGQVEVAAQAFGQAMQIDPGVIRRLGLALPTRFEPGPGRGARQASDLLRSSPRFRKGQGFRLLTESDDQGLQTCLLGPQNERLSCVRVTPRAGEEVDDLPRRLARELHRKAFAPRVDLTQSDLRSLDGSPTAAGGRAAERMQRTLKGMVGE